MHQQTEIKNLKNGSTFKDTVLWARVVNLQLTDLSGGLSLEMILEMITFQRLIAQKMKDL